MQTCGIDFPHGLLFCLLENQEESALCQAEPALGHSTIEYGSAAILE